MQKIPGVFHAREFDDKHRSPVGKGSAFTADLSPDRVSLLHKGGCPICNSGCGDPIVEKFLRPPGNSPSQRHLTQGLLLCSRLTIHDSMENVNRFFQILEIFCARQIAVYGTGAGAPIPSPGGSHGAAVPVHQTYNFPIPSERCRTFPGVGQPISPLFPTSGQYNETT